MTTSISLRTGSLFVVLFAALLAGTVAFAGDRDNSARTAGLPRDSLGHASWVAWPAGPRNTIVKPQSAPKADALLAALEVDPADLESVSHRSVRACSAHRAGPRETVRACR